MTRKDWTKSILIFSNVYYCVFRVIRTNVVGSSMSLLTVASVSLLIELEKCLQFGIFWSISRLEPTGDPQYQISPVPNAVIGLMVDYAFFPRAPTSPRPNPEKMYDGIPSVFRVPFLPLVSLFPSLSSSPSGLGSFGKPGSTVLSSFSSMKCCQHHGSLPGVMVLVHRR